MQIVSTLQMQESDKTTIEKLKIPGSFLMESAGQACANHLLSNFRFQSVCILVGPGNNGGDGYVIARHLHLAGKTTLICHQENHKGSDDRELHRSFCVNLCIPTISYEQFLMQFPQVDLIVDSLFGIGLRRELTGVFKELINSVNQSNLPIFSVDIPSGVDSETGMILGAAIQSNRTLSFEAAKPGHFLNEGLNLRGILHLQKIGIQSRPTQMRSLSFRDFQWMKKSESSHKATSSALVCVGGELGLVGALRYSALAAFQAGVGLVSLRVPQNSIVAYQSLSPEIMCQPLGYTLPKNCVALIGPGAGQSKEIQAAMKKIIEANHSLVIDADALKLFGIKEWESVLKNRQSPTLLTPHPGEIVQLFGKKEVSFQELSEFAQNCQVGIILKGAVSILAHADGSVDFLAFPNAALAKGGSGDVLAGMCAAALCLGMNPKEALTQASLLHSISGYLMRMHRGVHSSSPQEQIDKISEALNLALKQNQVDLINLEKNYFESGLAPGVLELR